MPSREGLIERYACVSGLPVDATDYYVILAGFKMAVVLEGGYARQSEDGDVGNVVLDMARNAAELARTTTLKR